MFDIEEKTYTPSNQIEDSINDLNINEISSLQDFNDKVS